MKTELLILVANDESFCNSKKAFVDFLKIDSLLSVSGQKIIFKRSAKAKELVSARFRVETDKVKSKQERYFLVALECQDEGLIDEFSELCERIKTIAERISPGSTTINTIWDDVGRIYAERSYPLINEVENLMRRLITKFMIVTVGMNWSKDAIHPDLFKKIENFEEEDPYHNDLYKLDFIHLRQVLFDKKRDISLEELDRILNKTTFSDEDKERILKYVPRSNWEKYFSSLIGEKNSNLEHKWELLYKLRNKVAHNRQVKKDEFEKIKGLSSQIKEIISKATAKLGEIDLNEEDRELIIYTYNADSPAAIGYLTEKAVAEYYMKSGYEILISPHGMHRQFLDFYASKGSQKIAVEVKSVRSRHFVPMLRNSIQRQLAHILQSPEAESFTKLHLVCVLREEDIDYPVSRIYSYLMSMPDELTEKLEIFIGKLNEENSYVPLEQ